MVKRIIIIGLTCLFLISVVSCGGETLTEPVVSEKTTPTDNMLSITSPFEAIKAFYSAANRKNYSEAQKYLFSDFLNLFEEPPISQVGGIERILDLFTANGAIKEITFDREEFIGSSEEGGYPGDGWSPEINQAFKQGNTKVWYVYYTIEFESPLGEKSENACVVKEADTYRISTGWENSGLSSSIINAAASVLWDFTVYDISSQPGREGYTEYQFLIGMKHSVKGLFPMNILSFERGGLIKAVWEQYEYKGGFYIPCAWTDLPMSLLPSDLGEYWPSDYTYIIKSRISIPAAITSPIFYLITPDLRYFKIDPDGPWPEIPASPTLEWFRLGQTLEVKDYWAITPLALKKSNDGKKFILQIRLENLSGYDQAPEESLYFLQIRPVVSEFSSELSDLGVIPAFCEREFEIEISSEVRVLSIWEDESGKVFEELSEEISIPIEGAKADLLVVVKDKEIKKPISYKIYRLK